MGEYAYLDNNATTRPLRQLLHAKIVDDDEVWLEVSGQHSVDPGEGLVVQEVADQIKDRSIQHREACFDGSIAEGPVLLTYPAIMLYF